MRTIGVTGPTGAGKTTVLAALEALGYLCLDCDRVYHRLLEESQPLLGELTDRFGRSILDSRGKLDRKALGAAVFAHPDALADLNAITHRYVLAQLDREAAQAAALGKVGVVFDAIGLIESGLGERCDLTLAVLAPKEVRLRRIMARDGIGEDYARARVEAQRPDEFYVNNCDRVIDNDGTKTAQEIQGEVAALIRSILC